MRARQNEESRFFDPQWKRLGAEQKDLRVGLSFSG
jgi:hypothetical protein